MRIILVLMLLCAMGLCAGCFNGSAAASNQGARADWQLGSF